MEKTQIYKELIKKHGKEKQIIVAIEEMSELQKECCKFFRGKENRNNLIEEITDVEIMIEQLKIIFNVAENVEKEKQLRLERIRKTYLAESEGKECV